MSTNLFDIFDTALVIEKNFKTDRKSDYLPNKKKKAFIRLDYSPEQLVQWLNVSIGENWASDEELVDFIFEMDKEWDLGKIATFAKRDKSWKLVSQQ